jgi:hypothetical protein
MIAQREKISKNRELQDQKMLQIKDQINKIKKENYPVPFVIVYSIFIAILSITAIVIQILMIFN